MTEHHVPTGPHELELEMLDLVPALEAVLMVADQPLDHLTLAQAVGHPPTDVAEALAALAEQYTADGRGFELRNIAGGWRYFTREEYAGAVERFILEGQQARLTQAALETMAVVAYRQPISRTRISAIRGVNVDSVVRTLVTRGLVEEGDVDPESGAILYRTTSYFLERMGMGSLAELPDIAPLLPEIEDMDDEAVTTPEPEGPQDAIGDEASDPGPSDEDAPEEDAPDEDAPDEDAPDDAGEDVEVAIDQASDPGPSDEDAPEEDAPDEDAPGEDAPGEDAVAAVDETASDDTRG